MLSRICCAPCPCLRIGAVEPVCQRGYVSVWIQRAQSFGIRCLWSSSVQPCVFSTGSGQATRRRVLRGGTVTASPLRGPRYAVHVLLSLDNCFFFSLQYILTMASWSPTMTVAKVGVYYERFPADGSKASCSSKTPPFPPAL